MATVIDLSSEVLVDRSQVRNPYLRLLLTALGQEVARGSPWIAVDKVVAASYEPLLPLIGGRPHYAAG
jgi:hypothetical protein